MSPSACFSRVSRGPPGLPHVDLRAGPYHMITVTRVLPPINSLDHSIMARSAGVLAAAAALTALVVLIATRHSHPCHAVALFLCRAASAARL